MSDTVCSSDMLHSHPQLLHQCSEVAHHALSAKDRHACHEVDVAQEVGSTEQHTCSSSSSRSNARQGMQAG